MAVLTLSDMLLGAGLLHGSRILSYEQLLMDSEIWSMLEAMFKGIEVTPQTLALDVIQSVGQFGSYLSQRHTRQFMRERWVPTLIDRRPYNVWEEKHDGARDWARAKARQILTDYHSTGIDEKQDAEFSRIIASVENKG
jgi:trimethylamine--corrinoid protein Co-methyltransferase